MENYARPRIFYKVRKTAIEMLYDRGFTLSQDEVDLTFSEFVARLNETKINIEGKKIDSDKLAYVYFFLDNKTFGKKDLVQLKEFIEEKYAKKDISVIIILEEKPTSQLNKEILLDDYHNFETFLVKNLMINITKHYLVPKHILLHDQKEINQILEDYQCTAPQLPKLSTTDPVAKYYGYKSGAICKILRSNPMTGEENYYRIVR